MAVRSVAALALLIAGIVGVLGVAGMPAAAEGCSDRPGAERPCEHRERRPMRAPRHHWSEAVRPWAEAAGLWPAKKPRRPAARPAPPGTRRAAGPHKARRSHGGPAVRRPGARHPRPSKAAPRPAPAAPKSAPAARPAGPVAGTPGEVPASDGSAQGPFSTAIAILILLLAFAAWQIHARTATAARRSAGSPRRHREGRREDLRAPPPRPPDAATVAATLARPRGLGVLGPGANGLMRAVIVDLITAAAPAARVIITRNELNRLFEGDFEPGLRAALAPRLFVAESLDQAIDHIYFEVLMGEAERANPDVCRAGGPEFTCWIATPDPDFQNVLPLLENDVSGRLAGLLFGEWPYGRTCLVDHGGRVQVKDEAGAGATVSPLGPAEALARLRRHARTTGRR